MGMGRMALTDFLKVWALSEQAEAEMRRQNMVFGRYAGKRGFLLNLISNGFFWPSLVLSEKIFQICFLVVLNLQK